MAVSETLHCNSCKEPLITEAFVTICFHVFCLSHGNLIRTSDKCRCPICSRDLSGKYYIVKKDLNPPTECRSMLLAGLQPEVILKVIEYSLSFWNSQMFMKSQYEVMKAKNHMDMEKQKQKEYENAIFKYQADKQNLQQQCQVLENQIQILTEKLNHRTRQVHSLQSECEKLKRPSNTFSKVDEFQYPFQHPEPHLKSKQLPVHQPLARNLESFRLSQNPVPGTYPSNDKRGAMTKFRFQPLSQKTFAGNEANSPFSFFK